ncbi:MAG: ribbon-helix-helix domain-containing protein [Thermoplasmatota archaeon]
MIACVTMPAEQEQLLDAFVETGRFHNKSEVARAALSDLIEHQPEGRCVSVPLLVLQKRSITVSRAAETAGKSYGDMEAILAKEGLLGTHLTAAELANDSPAGRPAAPRKPVTRKK